jgi:putative FmdB family regulatory protein
MPLYSYQCTICGVHLDQTQSVNDRLAPDCPNGHGTTRRVFSPPAVIFKGSGFYSTDSRRSGSNKTSAQES